MKEIRVSHVLYILVLWLICVSSSCPPADAFVQSRTGKSNVNRLQMLHPPKTQFQSEQQQQSASSSSTTTTSLSMWSSDDELEGADKFKACIPYMLPLLDGEPFGRYIYERIAPLGFLDSLFIGPLGEVYSRVPFSGLLFFVALTLGTRGNTDMSRGVRFNAQQAAMISVVLTVPELIGLAFEGEDMPRYVVEPCFNFVWYTYMSMVLYSIYSNLRGKKPDQIPFVSGLAEFLVGPF